VKVTPANAVVDALSPLDVEHIEMPTHPNKVWDLIHQAAEAR